MNWVAFLLGVLMVINTRFENDGKTTTTLISAIVVMVWLSIAMMLILTGLFYNQLVILWVG